MLPNSVYQSKDELDRLSVQNLLFKGYEDPVYERVLGQYTNAFVLDVGCNNGSKLTSRFAKSSIVKAVGLEFHEDLVTQAQAQYGDDIFSFYHCDVEGAGFLAQLQKIMEEQGIIAFDVIHISLVLLHLQHPERVLSVLHQVLSPCGTLIVVEVEDGLCKISPDPNHLCQGFVEALAADPYSGNRSFGKGLCNLLETCGYDHIAVENEVVSGDATNPQKKRTIFDTFCSYIKEDVLLMPETLPWMTWVNDHHQALEHLIVEENTTVDMGLLIVTCRAKSFRFAPLTPEYVEAASRLCDCTVGENLYPKEYLSSILEKSGYFFSLLLTPQNEIAGYIHFFLTNLEEMAAFAKLPIETLSVISQRETPVVGNLQSIAVAPEYEHMGLSGRLVEHYLEILQQEGADLAFGIFWKPNGIVSMGKTLENGGFVPLCDVYDVWADAKDLHCPYCKGACHCMGTIYFQSLLSEGGGFL